MYKYKKSPDLFKKDKNTYSNTLNSPTQHEFLAFNMYLSYFSKYIRCLNIHLHWTFTNTAYNLVLLLYKYVSIKIICLKTITNKIPNLPISIKYNELN